MESAEAQQIQRQEDPIRPIIERAKENIERAQYSEAIYVLDAILSTTFEEKDSSQNYVDNIDDAINQVKVLAEKVGYPKSGEIHNKIVEIEDEFLGIQQNDKLTEEQKDKLRVQACIHASNEIKPYLTFVKNYLQEAAAPKPCIIPFVIGGVAVSALAVGAFFLIKKRNNK